MKVLILGIGRARCEQLTASTGKAVQGLGDEVETVKVTEIKKILKFQILMTLDLAIHEKVKAAARVPSAEQIREMLLEQGGK